jgi:hypothetical protein
MTLRETAKATPDPKGWRSEQQRLDEEQQQRAEEDARCEELRKWISWKLAHEMIKSDLIGLYEEMDKLVKALPKEPITPLQLKITNDVLGKAKALLSGDTTIDQIEVFEGAAKMPEYRDVIIVLRQIHQGLERFESRNKFIFSSRFDDQLEEYNL